jgi:hypothetical protein
VIPSDYLAGYVSSKLERPASLVIALRGLDSASQGTLRTAIRQASKPVLCPRAGAIVPLEERSPRWIDFGSGNEPCVAVSWDDVATAFHGTGAGKITAYFRRTTLFRSADILVLTLHGASGTDDEDLREAIAAGINMIHINTELRVAWRRGMEDVLIKHPDEVVPYKILPFAVESVKQVVCSRLRLFKAESRRIWICAKVIRPIKKFWFWIRLIYPRLTWIHIWR